jgi:drug/metabolite transporter (DMT)-like permease
MPAHLLLACFAGFAFAVSSLFLKRAFQEGAGVMQMFLMNNLALGLAFAPLLLLSRGPVPWSLAYLPAMAGAAYLAAQLTNFTALRVGDVSLVGPILGSKVIFVALLGRWLFAVPLTTPQWIAAGMTSAGVAIMGSTDIRPGRRIGLTVVFGLVSSLAFASCDVIIQRWAPEFEPLHFVPLLFSTAGAATLLATPFFVRQVIRTPRPAWKWLAGGAVFTAVQSLLITLSISIWGDATRINVVYSLRGLWGIALVWVVGHWFSNQERKETGHRRMALRAAGSLLIVLAVVIAVFGHSWMASPQK